MRARLLAMLAMLTLLGGAAEVGARPIGESSSSSLALPRDSNQPNIVLILTDDQRWDTLWAMPNVQAELVAHGVEFTNAIVVNALCCPSRATILTGQYSHGTRIYDNSGPNGGFHHFTDTSTVATWLHDDGYYTGLYGKYLNQYNSVTYIPPGWDRWAAFLGEESNEGAAYYGYSLNVDGTEEAHGRTEADYSTDVLSTKAQDFILTAPPGKPLFLHFSPFAPHDPSTPAQAYKKRFGNLQPYRPPNYNEGDVSDKPAWVQALPLLSNNRQSRIDQSRKNQYRSLLSVDDAVGGIIDALTQTGRLDNTLIVFASDNGWALGEHRWNRKRAAYEEVIRIPMVVRYDPLITAPRDDPSLVANLDLAPTFAAAAGVGSPGAEGMSLLPLLEGPSASWRHDLLVEHMHLNTGFDEIPSFCAIRDDAVQPEGYAYTVYDSGEEELYDLKSDSYELDNVALDPGHLSVLKSFRTLAQTLCSPAPPRFVWPYDALPPSVPVASVANTEEKEVDIAWTASTDNVAVTGYTVYRDGAVVGSVGATTLAFADTAVQPGTMYSYTVDAFDASDNHSAQSAPVTAVTLADVQPPTVPTDLSAVASSPILVNLTWTASTDDDAVAGYTIYRDGGQIGSVDGATTTYADSTVVPGGTYSYTVDAFDRSGNHSAPSSASVVTTPVDTQPPSIPTNLSGTAPTPNSVDLSWSPSTDDVGVAGYTIYRDGGQIGTVDGATTAYTDGTVLPGTTYVYTVDAFDAAGNHSASSDPVTVTTPSDRPPGERGVI